MGSSRPPIDRRSFLGAIAGGVLAPLVAEAQRADRVARIGMLRSLPEPPGAEPVKSLLVAFRAGLRDRGYVDGQHFTVDYRFPATSGAVSALAQDLVRLNVDVIHASGPAAVHAASRATSTLPIVAHDLETDPLAAKLIATLAKPGGNVTGMFLDLPELNGKFLELLKAMLPRLRTVAALWDPSAGRALLGAAEEAARIVGVRFQVFDLGVSKLEQAVHTARNRGAEALLVLSSPVAGTNVRAIAKAAIRDRLPSIGLFRSFATAGGLMSYGPVLAEMYRREGRQVARILSGAKTAEVPVERPPKFSLVINIATAQALGFTMPSTLLLRADQVID